MTVFDQIKAQKEIVTGLAEIFKLIHNRCQIAEKRTTESEAEFNALVKLMRFTEGLLDEARAKLTALEKRPKD